MVPILVLVLQINIKFVNETGYITFYLFPFLVNFNLFVSFI